MKLGLIGNPLSHSWSPQIHKLLINADYQLWPLAESKLDAFFEKKDFDGINVTIPYKQSVMKYLDEISPDAEKIGAVNCIRNDNGRLIGHNTDCEGFRLMIEKNGIDVNGKRIAVLGSGGASRAVVAALEKEGAVTQRISRSAKKDDTISYAALYEEADSFDGIVNTTPVGMFPEMDETPVDLDQFQNLSFVIDVIANPLRTKLLFEAKCRGIRTLGGFEMLVRQAYAADLIFTGKDLPSESADECLAEIYRKKRNIVLIGMPTSGKTTMSALVGEKSGRPVIEMDDEIVRKLGTGIKECFAEKGEAYFRQKETEVARDFREGKGLVISCGGGVIKTPETMRYLSENGLIIWIKRNVDQLYPTDSRPLSSTDDALHKLYEERLPLYRMYADMVADNTGTIEETVNSILKMTGGDRK